MGGGLSCLHGRPGLDTTYSPATFAAEEEELYTSPRCIDRLSRCPGIVGQRPSSHPGLVGSFCASDAPYSLCLILPMSRRDRGFAVARASIIRASCDVLFNELVELSWWFLASAMTAMVALVPLAVSVQRIRSMRHDGRIRCSPLANFGSRCAAIPLIATVLMLKPGLSLLLAAQV